MTRKFGDAINSYTEIAKLSPEEGQVYVDLGYAYENDGKTDKALENYLKAIELNNHQYATAYLTCRHRLSPQTGTNNATQMFDEAERLIQGRQATTKD